MGYLRRLTILSGRPGAPWRGRALGQHLQTTRTPTLQGIPLPTPPNQSQSEDEVGKLDQNWTM